MGSKVTTKRATVTATTTTVAMGTSTTAMGCCGGRGSGWQGRTTMALEAVRRRVLLYFYILANGNRKLLL